MNPQTARSIKACLYGAVLSTVALAIGGAIQSPQARMGVQEVTILFLCTIPVISVIGFPISYLCQRQFASLRSPITAVVFGVLGVLISQIVLVVIVFAFIASDGSNALGSTFNILYEREWRFITFAFALAGAVIGYISMSGKTAAEQDGADQPATRSEFESEGSSTF